MVKYKYRYWDEVEKRMIYFSLGELLNGYNDEGNYPTVAETDLFRIRNDIDLSKVMDHVLDTKSGQEIYEGDIVGYEPFNTIGIVQWINQPPAYIIMRADRMGAYSLHDEWQVLGNIHENLEIPIMLIEGK